MYIYIIYNINHTPYIIHVYSFAIAGLRSLFGVLATAVDSLKYLDKVCRVA